MVFENRQDVGETNYVRRFKSPPFNFSNSATILTTAFKLFDFHRDNVITEKYGSFNNLSISNSSASNGILVFFNQNQTNGGIFIPAGTTREFDNRIMGHISSLLIQNVGSGSITANEIRLTIWKDLTDEDSIRSRTHEKLFSSEPNPLIEEFNAVISKIKDAMNLQTKGFL